MQPLLLGDGAPPPADGPLNRGAAEVQHEQVLLLSTLALRSGQNACAYGRGGGMGVTYGQTCHAALLRPNTRSLVPEKLGWRRSGLWFFDGRVSRATAWGGGGGGLLTMRSAVPLVVLGTGDDTRCRVPESRQLIVLKFLPYDVYNRPPLNT